MRMSGSALRSCGWPAPAAVVWTQTVSATTRAKRAGRRFGHADIGHETFVTQTFVTKTPVTYIDPGAKLFIGPLLERAGVLPAVEWDRAPIFLRLTSLGAFLPRQRQRHQNGQEVGDARHFDRHFVAAREIVEMPREDGKRDCREAPSDVGHLRSCHSQPSASTMPRHRPSRRR